MTITSAVLRGFAVALGGLAVLSLAAPPAFADDEEPSELDEALREIRNLRDRVGELEDWKKAREAEDATGGVTHAQLQSAIEDFFQARGDVPMGGGLVFAPRSMRIRLGGHIRVRMEKNFRSYNQRAAPTPGAPGAFDVAGNDTNDFVLGRVRAHADIDIAEDLRAYIELQDARVWGTEPGTASNTGNVDLSQGYVDFSNVFCDSFDLRLGRQAVSLSDQRFVGALEWSNTGRRFDGLTGTLRGETNKAILFAYRTAEGFIEPAGTFGPLIEGGDTDTNIYGVWWIMPEAVSQSVFELFGIYADSGIPGPSEPEFPQMTTMARGDTSFGTYGSRLSGKDEDSGIDWDFQAAAQRGHIADDQLSAWAARGEIGKSFPDSKWKPRVAVEYDFATGEKRLNDGRREQFQVLFPTNHGYYGIHDYAAWSNMRAWAATLQLQPSPKVKVKLQYWNFELDESAGGWVVASGALLRPGMNRAVGQNLGQEVDLIVTWQATDHVQVQAGLAHFKPGNFVRDTQPAEGTVPTTHFFYLQTLVTF